MNNIILYDICAMCILLILLIVVKSEVRGERFRNRILKYFLTITLLTAVFDMVAGILTNMVSENASLIPVIVATDYLYFIFHNMVYPFFVLYLYASFDIWYILNKQRDIWFLWTVVLTIGFLIIISNVFTGYVFTVDANGLYHRGPGMYVIYLVAIFYGGWAIGILIRNRKSVALSKMIVLSLAVVILIAAVIIQALYPMYLLDAFGVALALLVYILVIQRSENSVDPVSGAMKYYRAIDRIKSAYMMKRPFAMIFIKITNSRNQRKYLGDVKYSMYLNMQATKIREIASEMEYIIDLYYMENGEFAVFADDDNRMKAIEFACKVNEYYEEACAVDQFEVIPDACILVAKCPEDIPDANSLITLSLNYYETFNYLHSVIDYGQFKDDRNYRIKNEMDFIIENALAERKFEVYYQPIYSTRENRYVSAEALLRLDDDRYGYISPADFIPAAEAGGYIHELGAFVIEEVIKFISENDLDGLGLRYIQINLSASQCIEADLVDKVTELLAKYRVSPQYISMELTETAADINPKIVNMNVMRLHDAGIRFALDDYGVGYSNIRRVTSLPFSQVKLDKSFIDDIDNPVMWGVIKDTISMFKEMGKEILVEGIEDEAVARRFMEEKIDLLQGCDFMQGFYFCKPIPQDIFMEFIISSLMNNRAM